MELTYDILNIGALSKNRFWGETQALRTAHATSTVIQAGEKKILVDPSIPSKMLDARLFERSGMHIGDIDMVFLTNFNPAHRLGLAAFYGAAWLMHAPQIDHSRQYLQDLLEHLHRNRVEDIRMIEDELSLLDNIRPPGERLADGVEIFPSPGPTAGSCSLILTQMIGTVIIAGDAIVNRDYLQHGRVHESCYDAKAAIDSMQDILEVADIVIPGHDNLIPLMGKFVYPSGQ